MVELYEREGGEFRVNTFTTSDQRYPTITALSDGGFVVSWMSLNQDGSGFGIYAQRYAADGSKVSGEFLVNTTTANNQEYPAITALADGGFVVSWGSLNQDGSGWGVYAQRYAADGSRSGGEFLVNTTTTSSQLYPAITALPDGGFVVSWMSQNQDGSNYGVYAQLYAANGSKSGGELLVNTTTANEQQFPAITALSDGGFVVSWMSLNQDGSSWGVYAQRYAADGSKSGGEFLVNTTTASAQMYPAITALSDGGFVVNWMSFNQDGSSDIYAQRYAADGNKSGGEFLVNTTTTSNQQEPAITALSDGGFMVSWMSLNQDGSGSGIYAQRYAADGSKVGGEFLVNTATANDQQFPTITVLADGTLVVSWESAGQDGSGYGVYAQRFTPDLDGITDIELSNLTLSEAAIENIAVATLSNNGSVNGAVTYQILSDSTGGAFRIEDNQLVVADNARLDFETAPGVTITVRATDENGRSYEETFTLAISDSANEIRLKANEELLVNTTTANHQQYPTITALSDGGFMVSWQSSGQDGSGAGVYAQRYAANGSKSGGEFLVNTTTADEQQSPAITALSGGGFVVSWMSLVQDGSGFGIYAQRYAADGSKVGGEFLVNTTTANHQRLPAITALSDGSFVISWMSSGQDGSGDGIYAQRYAADGSKSGGEFLVNTTTASSQQYPTITALSDGGFVVSWMSFSQDGSGYDVYAQRYAADGSKVNGEFRVNTTTANDQQYPAITALSDGGFVVSWHASDGGGWGIYAQRYAADGSKTGGEFLVNTTTASNQRFPAITALSDGGFLVSWMSLNQDGSDYGIYAQRYAADGSKTGGEFLVNTTTANNQEDPAITALSDGTLVVSWTSWHQDGSGFGIYAKTFTAANTAIAENDAVATNETAAITGNVLLDNGSGADRDQTGAALEVAAVNGQAAAVGQQITLASGALLTLNADGTFSYDPNGAFDHLPGPGSGASNTSALDSFTYTLKDGATATVSVTITGVSSIGERLEGSAGADSLTGTTGADLFLLHQGGSDTASGGEGNDGFYFGSALDALDDVDGGAGAEDQLAIQGAYGAAGALFTLGASNLVNVETLALLSGQDTRFGDTAGNFYSYHLATVDANVAAGDRLTVNWNGLQAGENVTFDGSAETDGAFLIFAGFGTDTITGGAQSDGFYFGDGGRFNVDDTVVGGGGADDQLGLRGDYSTQLVFTATTMQGVETLALLSAKDVRFGAEGAAYSYNIKTHDGNVAAGESLVVSATSLKSDEALIFDGSAELDGSFSLRGGAGNDTLAGGALGDQIYGGLGADTLTGGGGADVFLYRSVTESTAAAADTILDFLSGEDKIDLGGIDANTGTPENDPFSFIGTSAFSGAAGELRYQSADGKTIIQGDVDGDGIADFQIELIGTIPLQPGDFLL